MLTDLFSELAQFALPYYTRKGSFGHYLITDTQKNID